MAKLIGGFGISHTPSMGVEFDRVSSGQPASTNWQPWFKGTVPLRDWLARMAPDRLVIIYNDHLNHFDFAAYPTLAIGVADTFRQADEGWGLRPLPDLKGDTSMALHLTEKLVRGGFDLTVCQDLAIDHGIYSWLPYVMSPPWPIPITPLAVNMVRHPIPTSERLQLLGQHIGRAIASFPADDRVLIVSTGGMSHQISGARFGIANETLDQYFLERLRDHVAELVAIPQEELMRIGGTEAAELAIWFVMRGALPERLHEAYRYYTFPALTGCGIIAYETDFAANGV
jgi:hypothetical protein